jgi:hypothetical protein
LEKNLVVDLLAAVVMGLAALVDEVELSPSGTPGCEEGLAGSTGAAWGASWVEVHIPRI